MKSLENILKFQFWMERVKIQWRRHLKKEEIKKTGLPFWENSYKRQNLLHHKSQISLLNTHVRTHTLTHT